MIENNYQVYKIIYTNNCGERVSALVAEDSSEEALETLEETLINLNYSEKDIEKLIPLVKTTGEASKVDWIKLL